MPMQFNMRFLNQMPHMQNPRKPDSSVLALPWRTAMQIAHFTMGTAVLTFLKHLVRFIIEGVTQSCETTF